MGLGMVVGLGNPGARYAATRHNAGFWVVRAAMAARRSPPTKLQLQAQVSRHRQGGSDLLWCMPQTFMNDSGRAVGALLRYYRLEPSEVLVVHDELAFAPGELRLKAGGGHGGHNGLRSLIAHVGADFGRLRVGIGRPPGAMDQADYVLAAPGAADKPLLAMATTAAVELIASVDRDGLAATMNRLHAPL